MPVATFQRTEDQRIIHQRGVHDALAHRVGDMNAEHQEGRPDHGILRLQHAGRDKGGDGIGRVMKAVHEVEGQRHHDQQNERDGYTDLHPGRQEPPAIRWIFGLIPG